MLGGKIILLYYSVFTCMADNHKIKVIDKKLGRQKAVGQAYTDARVIEVDPRQRSKNYLDTLIHEMLHVYCPDWSESKVTKTANEMTDIIWQKNFRRIKR